MAEICASQLITRKGIGRDKAAPMLLALCELSHMKNPKEDNRLFIIELTTDLRNSEDEFWVTLRQLVSKNGVDIKSVALCQFCESEDGIEYGLLVAQNHVIEFQHESYNTKSFKLWRETIEPILVYSDCQDEVDWTREILCNGEV